ncbi:MAG: DNA-directed RNA polymerase subunit omega [Clostridia bacterium]|nr:DNA-directed RNA polymerase subunit omega [Clostridia bacterium]
MLVKPTVLELLNQVDSRFQLVTATAKRARQLAAGSKPLTKKSEPSPVSLAAVEIAEGKVKVC